MPNVNLRKRITVALFTVVVVTALVLGAVLSSIFLLSPQTARATTNVSTKVTPLELMSVHQVDWVMGPLDVNSDGTYKEENKDSTGALTNNVYGIPANRYFNIENYLYTTTSGSEKTVYGWKNNIQRLAPGDESKRIHESGYIQESGTITNNLGIYCDALITASMNKYMLIMPDDITQIGTGSGAFNGHTISASNSTGTSAAGYSDFAFFVFSRDAAYNSFSTNWGYWSPRERLAGVYFNDTSKLNLLQDGLEPNEGAFRKNKQGKGAFAGCDNLKFFILPKNDKLTTIGQYALADCSQMRDFNIPGSVTTVKAGALNNCSSVMHLTVPASVTTVESKAFGGMSKLADVENYSQKVSVDSFPNNRILNYYSTEGGSQLFVVGNDAEDRGASGYYFCKNARGYTGTLATVTVGTSQNYVKDNWYVVALSGKEDSTGDIVHYFPKEVVPNGERRKNILYDYLDSSGQKCKNVLSSTITKYDIGSDMANSTWCTGAVIPSSVEIIGNSAFFFSHVQYLELSATTLGNNAFSTNTTSTINSQQYYYIHNKITSYGTNVFYGASGGATRQYIFENKNLYDEYVNSSGNFKASNVFGTNAYEGTGIRKYLIPIYANVQSNDGDVNIDESDIDARYSYDADYNSRKTVTAANAQGNGNYKILVTKRLSGSDFTSQKQASGAWSDASDLVSSPYAEPVISGMDSTVWYKKDDYNDKTTAADEYTSNATAVNIYTKKVAKPAIVNKVDNKAYTFGDDIPQEAIDLLDLHIGNPEYKTDYVAKITDFVFASGRKAAVIPKALENAGTYQVAISLNSAKWGVWSEDYAGDFVGTVVVKQQEIDLTDINNIPKFYTNSGSLLGGSNPDEAITLYQYGTEWFLFEQNGETLRDSKIRKNAYANFAGNEVNITVTAGEWEKYNIYSGTGTNIASPSGFYTAGFDLSVETIDNSSETNYIFIYSKSGDAENQALFESYGLYLSSMTTTNAKLGKEWFIVKQPNKFIDSDDTFVPEEPYATPSYVIARDSLGSAVRTWEYEAVGINIRLPKIAYNQNYVNGAYQTVNPTFTLTYSGKEEPLVKDADADTLRKYINSTMPVGTYTIVMSAPSVTEEDGKNYPGFSESYTVNVTPKALDTTALEEKLKNGGKTYEFEYDGEVHLHNSVAAELDALNAGLNLQYAQAQRDGVEKNYWADKSEYFGVAGITYNLNRMGSNVYYAADAIPAISSDEYIVYYAITAKNHVPVGGEDDTDRRDKVFNTLIYRAIKTSELLGNGYFQDVTYAPNTDAYTNVPYQTYYDGPKYNDGDYKNARDGATVTLILSDTKLTRWKNDSTEKITVNNVDVDKVALDESDPLHTIHIRYNILPAQNGWAVSPQMPSWSFNGFDKNINVITSGLLFAGANVSYRLGVDGDDGETIWTDYFTVGSYGIVNEEMQSVLNLLKPGNYYLESKIENISYEAEDGTTVANVLGGTFVAQNGATRLATVNIAKANNRWTRSPNIIRWTWGEYIKERHTISAVSLYPNLLGYDFFPSGSVKSVEYQVLRYIPTENGTYTTENILNLSMDANGDAFWFTGVTDIIAQALGNLPAGDYVLRSRLIGNDYYYDIEEQDFVFDIAQASNRWALSPSVVRWTWGAYNPEVNVISATPLYNKAGTIHYTILNSEYYLADPALRNFTAVTKDIADVLAGLPAGDYYLLTSMAGDSNFRAINDWDEGLDRGENYAFGSVYDFTDAARNKTLSPVHFNIGQARNTWQSSPRLTGWQYTKFENTNFVAGVPQYKAEGSVKVEYEIIKSSATVTPANKPQSGAGHFYFTLDADVSPSGNALPATIVEYLEKIPVLDGNTESYWLIAYYPGTDNYDELLTATSFAVSASMENSWKTLPSITDWTYDGYNGNFTAGEATFGNDSVRYEIKIADPENANSYLTMGDDYKNLDGVSLVNKLGSLGAGSYQLYIATSSSNDYVAATRELTFTVSKSNNQWDVEPTVSGWTWGDTPNRPNDAKAFNIEKDAEGNDVNTVSYKYYNAVQNSSGNWIKSGDALADDFVFVAGEYICEFTAAESANYFELVRSVHFTVGSASNGWTVNPGGSLNWVWGSMNLPENFVGAQAVMPPVGEGTPQTVKYDIRKENETAILASATNLDENFISVFKRLGVGKYVVTVYVESTDNYAGVSATTYIEVTPAAFGWTTPPQNAEWKWNDDSTKTFTKPIAYGVTGDTVDVDFAIAYRVKKSGSSDYADFTVYDALLEDLKTRDAGTYTVTVTVSGDNYVSLSVDVDVVIKAGTFEWKTEPANASWTWGDTDKNLVRPEARIVLTGESASITYTVQGASDIGNTWDDVVAYLRDSERTAGTYRVTANIELLNYETLSGQFNVVIREAVNGWVSGYEPVDISRNYDQKLENVREIKALYGTVVLSVGSTTYGSLLDWVNTERNAGNYTITVSVAGSPGCYTSLNYDITLHIIGLGGTWDNMDELNKSAAANDITDNSAKYTFTYGDNLKDDIDKIVIPVKKAPAELAGATLVYEINKNGNINRYDTADDVIKHFKGEKAVEIVSGTYIVTAKYTTNNDNYASLEYTVTVIIGKATTTWDESTLPESEYINVFFQAFTGVKTPATSTDQPSRPVSYVVTKSGSQDDVPQYDPNDPKSGSFNDFLNTLDVGTYVITYRVIETDTYTGTDTKTVRVVIIPALNAWKENEPVAEITKLRSELNKLYGANKYTVITVPVPERGNLEILVNGRKLDASNQESFDLIMKEYYSAAGVYRIEFKVEPTNNFGGVGGTIIYTVSKDNNSWKDGKAPESGYEWTGSAPKKGESNAFAVPESMYGNGLLRFDIVRTGGTVVGKNLTESELWTELGSLAPGGYRITSRVGCATESEENEYGDELTIKNVKEYNADYNILEAFTDIQIVSSDNAWSTAALASYSWQYNDTAKINGFTVADSALGTVKITVSGNGTTERVFDEADYATFDDLKKDLYDYLGTLDSGEYVVTFEVPQGDNYRGLPATDTVVTVTPIPTEWMPDDNTPIDITTNENITINWTYGKEIGTDEGQNVPIPSFEPNWLSVGIIKIYTVRNSQGVIVGKYRLTYVETVTARTARANVYSWRAEDITDESNPKPIENFDLNDIVSQLGADTYPVNIVYIGDVNHAGIERNITVTIAASDNSWESDGGVADGATIGWTCFEDHELIFKVANRDKAETLEYYVNNVKQDVTSVDGALVINNVNRKAGEYNITLRVPANKYYNALEKRFTIIVSLADNSWSVAEDENNAQVTDDKSFSWTYGENHTLTFKASNNASTLKYYVNDVEQNVSLSDDEPLVIDNSKLTFGVYNVTLRVPADDFYNVLEIQFTINVARSRNEWTIEEDNNNISITDGNTFNWVYGETHSLKFTSKYNMSGLEYYVNNVRQSNTFGDSDTLEISNADRTAGKYDIVLRITEDNRYMGLELRFTVNVSVKENSWITNTVSGYNDITSVADNAEFKWTYGEKAPVISIKAEYNADKLLYYVNGVAQEAPTDGLLTIDCKDFTYGERIITLRVVADERYGGLEKQFAVKVERAVNAWTIKEDNNNISITDGNTFNWVYGETHSLKFKPTYNISGLEYYVNNVRQNFTLGDDGLLEISNVGRTLGEYNITLRIIEDDRYTGLEKLFTINVSRATNSWAVAEDENNAQVVDGKVFTWTYGESHTLTFKAAHNADKLEYYINDVKQPVTLKDNALEISNFDRNVGEYNIRLSVPADDKYGAVEISFAITVSRADNGLKTDLNIGGTNNSWTWDNGSVGIDVGLTVAKPLHGDIIIVTVEKVENSTRTEAFTPVNIHFNADGSSHVADVEILRTRLRSLDAGEYEAHVQISLMQNYNAFTGAVCAFEVKRAINDWIKTPTFTGEGSYGGAVYQPTSQPKYGNANDVAYSYMKIAVGENESIEDAAARLYNANKNNDSVWTTNIPNETGAWIVRGILAANDNYTALDGYGIFKVNAGVNQWTSLPGVNDWEWNGYSKTDNAFNGSALSRGNATFKIFAINNDASYRMLGVADFVKNSIDATLTETDVAALNTGIVIGGGNEDIKVVSDEIARLLNMLKPAMYRLHVTVDGGDNYNDIEMYTSFVVHKSNNEWITPASVQSFTYKAFAESGDVKTFTAAAPKYGDAADVVYSISGVSGGYDVLFENISASDIIKVLKSLNAGNYTLNAEIAGNDAYNALSARTVNFGISRADNGWITPPKMSTSAVYSVLKDMTAEDFSDKVYAKLDVLSNVDKTENRDVVQYAILNTDYSVYFAAADFDMFVENIKKCLEGRYIIRASLDETTNYRAIAYADTDISITNHANAFVKVPNKLTGVWFRGGDGKNATALDSAEITAQFGTPKFVFGGVTYNSYDELKDSAAVKALDSGSYLVTVFVDGTPEYAGVPERTLQLEIAAGQNSWLDDWIIDNSMTVTPSAAESAVTESIGWKWGDKVSWNNAKPKYGNIVYIDIKDSESIDSSLYYITVDYSGEDGGVSAIRSVGDALSGLNQGKYIITVSSPADTNWAALSDNVEFTVAPVQNVWTKQPTLSSTEWEYNTAAGTYSADSRYGVISYEFVKLDGGKENEVGSVMPADVGEYKLYFRVPADAHGNYNKLEEVISFKITRAFKNSFSVNPGAIGWTWNEYKREVNLFSAIPESGGAVTYDILFNGSVVSVDGVELKGILLVDIDGGNSGLANDLYVPQNIAKLLEKLPGREQNYTLRVNVAATDNYSEFSSITPLTVQIATNEWLTYPQFPDTWAVGSYDKSCVPVAKPKFGVATLIVYNTEAKDIILYKATYDSATEKFTETVNILEDAGAGMYVLEGSVPADPGHYNNALSGTYNFKIFIDGAIGSKNNWQPGFNPTIDSWIANLDDSVPVRPSARPIRGQTFFKFYSGGLSGGKPTGDVIDEKTGVLIESGNGVGDEYYMPYAPGDYVMEAWAEYYQNGILVEADTLPSTYFAFRIEYRENRFTEDLYIDRVLYLGDKANWNGATAKALEGKVEYTYYNIDTGTSVAFENINEPGKYRVTATTEAKYSYDEEQTVQFEVFYSQNRWIERPTIESWSEDLTPSHPTAEALVGNENIVYSYENVATGVIKNEIPTEAGSYILHALVKAPGYEDLTETYEFTIAAEFDTLLLSLNLAFACVACVFTVIVIIFAIRRYRQC